MEPFTLPNCTLKLAHNELYDDGQEYSVIALPNIYYQNTIWICLQETGKSFRCDIRDHIRKVIGGWVGECRLIGTRVSLVG